MTRIPSLASAGVALAILGALAGCGGPTKLGMEARKNAHDRFNRVGAAVSNDQAEQSLTAGQFQEALDHIDRVVHKFPNDPTARLLRGRIVLEMGRLELAMVEFRNAATLDPSCDECHYYQGIVYQRWGRDEEAEGAYEAALTIAPDNTHYLMAQAESLVALGRVEEANSIIDESECHFEFSSALAHLRAEIALAQGDLPAALHNMELAVTLATDPSVYQEDLAHVAFEAGEWDRCLGSIEALPASAADRDDIQRMRARCLAMTGRGAQARDALVAQEHAIEKRGDVVPIEHELTLGYIAAMISDWTRVDECARRLIGRMPQMADGYMLKGMALESAGDFAVAIEFLRKAVALAPGRPAAFALLSRAEAAQLAIGGVEIARAGR